MDKTEIHENDKRRISIDISIMKDLASWITLPNFSKKDKNNSSKKLKDDESGYQE